MRRVLVFVTAAGAIAAIAAVVALSPGGGHSRRALASRFVAPFAVHPWRNQAPLRGLILQPTQSAPLADGGTCDITAGRCSLIPCVDPVTAAPNWPPTGLILAPARRPAAHTCRRPKAPRSRTSSA